MAKSSSTEQQQRLQQLRQGLQDDWEQRSEKLKRLRRDCAIEAGTAVKFQLEKQIQDELAKLNDIDRQLNDIEAQLQLLSHTTIIPNTISKVKVHQTPELLSNTGIIEVFISYQKDDEKLLKELVDKHLNHVEGIKIWHEGKTIGGQNNKVEIEKHLNSSHIIMLLISPNYLKEYNNKFEIKLAIEREQAIKATFVIPVLLTKIFGWERFTFANFKLGDLEPLPQKNKFITDRKAWQTNNDAFCFIAEGLEKVKTKIVEKT
ncbi:toll/interleukin-1 receptor domain-containing protein [Nostoc sp. C057]|uniref:toll/interleukin-1 receptor domain-containing protein n=1 Tax=Nostoc sp. C057 TaxID=2576903 RepID=UPI0015C311A2|nr:toll/interleukin-1 receptor domain-containing protein [Nostoc sp. C057]QLE50012.1 toll/interleukin-1 receptor domain-containing protein [Nostoc sp. C057]